MTPEDTLRAILRIAERQGERGVSMGAIVDELVAGGLDEHEVEQGIWELLQERRLTPHGFVARTLGRRGRAAGGNGPVAQRVYEFVLIPWSPALDRQLDLQFDRDER